MLPLQSHKGPNLSGIDQESGALVRLFRPREDKWDDHFERNGVVILGRTSIGRATIGLLTMNAADRRRLRGGRLPFHKRGGSEGSETGFSNRQSSEHICRLNGEALIRAQSSLGRHACQALKVLSQERLVEILPNRDPCRPLMLEDVKHLFEVIAALESFAGRLTCERTTDAETREIKAIHYQMQASFIRLDLPKYFRLN
jgi:FCD domain